MPSGLSSQEESRCAETAAVKAIVRELPPFVLPIGVFVNEDAKVVRDIMDRSGLALAPLHGDETAAYCERWDRPVLKAIRSGTVDHFWPWPRIPGRAPACAVLGGCISPDAYGGTGQVAGWSLAAEAAAVARILLAGGLTPENVRRPSVRFVPTAST